MDLSVDYVREILKAFRRDGFDSLNPKWGGGRPRTFTDDVRRELANLATSRPADLGLPFQEWSLSRLARTTSSPIFAPLSREHIGELVRVLMHVGRNQPSWFYGVFDDAERVPRVLAEHL